MRNEVRKITEGAAMIALISVFLLVDRQFAGQLNVYFAWIIPLPIIIYTARHGFKAGWLPYFSVVIIAIMTATLPSMIFAALYGLVGLFYGLGVNKKFDNRTQFLFTSLFTTIIYFLSMVLFASFFGYDMGDEIKIVTEFLRAMDVEPIAGEANVVRLVIVMTIFFGAILEAYLLHILARILLIRVVRISIPPSTPLSKFKFPAYIGYILMALLFAWPLVTQLKLNQMGQNVGYTLFIFSTIVIIAHALILLAVLQKRHRIHTLVFTAILSLLLIPTIAVFPLLLIGLLDMVTDIRQKLLGVKKNA
jgi:uncharacterized protein YybS (DUF2232 family)